VSDVAIPTASGANYTAAHLGPLDELAKYGFFHPRRQVQVQGKQFLKEVVGTTGTEVSFTRLEPLQAVAFFHSHKQNEELFLVVRGEGEMQIDDEVIVVKEGSAVRVATAGERCLRNTSATDPMVYICIQAKTGSLEQWTFTDGVPSTRTAKWATL
jgi:uncharacterized cupin superfamily protein